MEDETTNDVVAVESNEDTKSTTALEWDQLENRPIMQLFKRLLSNDNKENTVLTNAQIVNILDKEFEMNIAKLHELEIDIYLNTIKKFLKDWPQWDDLDGVVNRLKSINAYDSIKNILNHKYRNLKEYLQVMIEATKPIAQNTLQEVLRDLAIRKDDKYYTSDVYMEICCTRPQLNNCFYRKPCDNFNKTVFNVTDEEQSRISLNTISLEAILNWWSVRVTVNFKFFYYKRELFHHLKHTLINKANEYAVPKSVLKDELQVKVRKKPIEIVKRQVITNLLDSILLCYSGKLDLYYLIGTVFNMIKADLDDIPEDVIVRASYRKYSNKYPYVRYLYSDTPSETTSADTKYDLQLEEVISPMHQFTIEKVQKIHSSMPNPENWLKIECLICKVKFTGAESVDSIKAHFNMSKWHSNEPMCTCTNCDRSFNITYLAENKWHHTC